MKAARCGQGIIAKYPWLEGRRTKSVDVLRNTEFSGAIVNQQHVTDDHYTGRVGLMQMVDNRVIRVPIANVKIDSPYLVRTSPSSLSSRRGIWCHSGKSPGARPADDPNLQWVEAQATVAKAARRMEVEGTPTLFQSPGKQWISVNREEIIKMQTGDDSLRGLRDMISEVKVRNRREVTSE